MKDEGSPFSLEWRSSFFRGDLCTRHLVNKAALAALIEPSPVRNTSAMPSLPRFGSTSMNQTTPNSTASHGIRRW
jgi:hypothetical protein